MLRLGMAEWACIVVLALLIFGPSRLPALGKSLADGIKNFRRGIKSTEKELTEVKDL